MLEYWSSKQSGTTEHLWAVWQDGTTYAAGDNGVILQNWGSGWFPMQSGTTENLRCFWKNDNGNLRVVGDNGTILELDYDTWTPVESGVSWDLVSIWGESVYSLNKYAVAGKNAPVIHYDGSNWNLSTGAAGRDLRSVWGISSNDVIAVGAGGTIIRYNNPPTPSSLNRLLTEPRRSPDTETAAGKIIYNIEYTFDDNSSKNGNIHRVVYDGSYRAELTNF